MANTKKKFPFSHVAGFILSLFMTFAAAGIALDSGLPIKTIMWLIGILAVLQAGLQLFMFMHMTEGEDGKTNFINIAYSFFIAIVIVAGTIWVMSFGVHLH